MVYVFVNPSNKLITEKNQVHHVNTPVLKSAYMAVILYPFTHEYKCTYFSFYHTYTVIVVMFSFSFMCFVKYS